MMYFLEHCDDTVAQGLTLTRFAAFSPESAGTSAACTAASHIESLIALACASCSFNRSTSAAKSSSPCPCPCCCRRKDAWSRSIETWSYAGVGRACWISY